MAAAHEALARLGVSGYIMCHLSHSYHAAACRLRFAIKPSGLREPLDEYDVVKSAIQQAFIDAGATLSHHHAVGTEHAAGSRTTSPPPGWRWCARCWRASTRRQPQPGQDRRRTGARPRAALSRGVLSPCVGGSVAGRRAVRAAELVAALCLATDLGMAFPFEHGLHSTLIAMRIADRLGVDRENLAETYYACLLAFGLHDRRARGPTSSAVR